MIAVMNRIIRLELPDRIAEHGISAMMSAQCQY